MLEYFWHTILLVPAPSKCNGDVFAWAGTISSMLEIVNIVVFHTDNKDEIKDILLDYLMDPCQEDDEDTQEFVESTLGMLDNSEYEFPANQELADIVSHILEMEISKEDIIGITWQNDVVKN